MQNTRGRSVTESDSRVMLAGSARLDGDRLIWWNLFASDQSFIDRATQIWKDGDFPNVQGD
ncbi:MAG: pirin-like C-terminal cupin domain-containing protein [Rhodospirillaceae bacterium]|nr:pirin-like C-terminal cupin domain-containing protein [Rhodospirillaceae bacterium]